MAESLLVRKGGGGAKIEELLKSYTVASGQTITAGTFVNYIQTSLTLGAETTFNAAFTSSTKITALDDNKIVVIYVDGSNSFFATAIVGTISGTTISWGSTYVFNANGTSDMDITSVDTNKIVIAYRNYGNSSFGTAKVGTISGTVITFGSEYVFNSNTTDKISIATLDTDKIIVAYDNNGNSNFNTAKVGTISGTVITFGSEYVFNNSNIPLSRTSLGYVTALSPDKVVFAYQHRISTSNFGKAKVGTISGTVITFGSEYEFVSSGGLRTFIEKLNTNIIIVSYTLNNGSGCVKIGLVNGTVITFGSQYIYNASDTEFSDIAVLSPDKIVISYRDNGNSNFGTVREAKIDAGFITFESPSVFNGSLIFDSNITSVDNNKIVVVYRDNVGSTDYGNAIVGTLPLFITDTKDEKVFGLAKTGGTAGQTVEVFVNK
jgi:predicted GNAT superfamily acetyltransferase